MVADQVVARVAPRECVCVCTARLGRIEVRADVMQQLQLRVKQYHAMHMQLKRELFQVSDRTS